MGQTTGRLVHGELTELRPLPQRVCALGAAGRGVAAQLHAHGRRPVDCLSSYLSKMVNSSTFDQCLFAGDGGMSDCRQANKRTSKQANDTMDCTQRSTT